MIGLILLTMLLGAGSVDQTRIFAQAFHIAHTTTVHVVVANRPGSENELTVSVSAGPRVKWSRSISISNGPISPDIQEPVNATVYGEAGTKLAKLVMIQAPIPDWEQTILWSVSAVPSEPVVLRFRAPWSDVSTLKTNKSGEVISFDLYDRWIGRESHSRMQPTKGVNDQIERVSHYVPGVRGVKLVWWRDRQVAHLEGGPSDRNFVWITRRHYVGKIESD
jgi:hypothetical protein